MDAEKSLKTCILLLFILFWQLPIASGRKAPEDSLTSAVSAPNTNTLGSELEVTLKAAAAGSETSEFYEDGTKTPSPTTSVIAGFQNDNTTGTQMGLKNWITWIVLLVLCSVGITVHCHCHNCYSKPEACHCTTSSMAATTLPINAPTDTVNITLSSAVSAAED